MPPHWAEPACDGGRPRWFSQPGWEWRTDMPTRMNVVLVHGAWADGSSWCGVIPRLRDNGFRVTAAQIPLTSLADDVSVTRRILSLQKGPTVLVGHSYGGMVITEAATGVPNVASLVYVSAFANDEAETLGELNARVAPPPGPSPLRFDDPGFVWIDAAAFAQVFAHDVDPVQAQVMAAAQKPIAAKIFGEKAGKPAWKSIPSWYLVSEDDRMIAPQTQLFMSKRIGATTVQVPGSHAALVSHAAETARLIVDATIAIAQVAGTKAAGQS
jgi:pimeloyl-ACP methyl ester carboxylesterase